MSRTDRLGVVILCAGLMLLARGALEWAFVGKAEAQGVSNCSSANASCRVRTITTTTATGTGAATFAQYVASGANMALEINRNAWIQIDGPGYSGACGLASSGSCITSTSKNFAHYSDAIRTHSTNSGGFVDFPQGILINNKLSHSATAPTITSACTSPTITHGSATSFQMDVGTTCAGISAVVLGLPTATNGWECHGYNKTTSATAYIQQTADSTTSATVTNYTRTTGVALAYVDGADLVITCTGR